VPDAAECVTRKQQSQDGHVTLHVIQALEQWNIPRQ